MRGVCLLRETPALALGCFTVVKRLARGYSVPGSALLNVAVPTDTRDAGHIRAGEDQAVAHHPLLFRLPQETAGVPADRFRAEVVRKDRGGQVWGQ